MVRTDGYKFWREKLNAARLVLAPMVEQSELPWRMLTRKYGAELCYTPMMHAGMFSRDRTYREENFSTCPEDRPLITQFCTDEPELFVKAAKFIEDKCDAVDLNLGCPQNIARRGHYGSYLQDEWELIHQILSKGVDELKIPVTAKFRIFDDINKTVEYAKMIESTGVALIAVHGRTREQKGVNTGLASWEHIKAVKNAVKIPVFANGNILTYNDVFECMKVTGCDGVMIAESNLFNPALFANLNPCSWDIALEYIIFTEKYPCCFTCIRAHLFKIFQKVFERHFDLREKMAKLREIPDIKEAIEEIKTVVLKESEERRSTQSQTDKLDYWLCQSYIRTIQSDEWSKEREALKKITDQMIADGNVNANEFLAQKLNEEKQATMTTTEANEKEHQISMLKIAKILERKKRKQDRIEKKLNARKVLAEKMASGEITSKRPVYIKCLSCKNPRGLTCGFELCRKCCRDKVFTEQIECKGHNLKYKAKDTSECQSETTQV